MTICFPFIKYIYISCFFIVAFMATYSDATEMIGYSCIFVLQTLFTIAMFLDVSKDPGKSNKVLYFPEIKNNLGLKTDAAIPIWWILFIGGGLQFAAALLTMITAAYLYKRFQTLRMSHDNRWRLSTYKIVYIICTVCLMILLFTFIQFNDMASGYYRLLLVVCFIGVLGCGSLDVYYANRLSKLIGSTTDG
jgi:hypothetical protein